LKLNDEYISVYDIIDWMHRANRYLYLAKINKKDSKVIPIIEENINTNLIAIFGIIDNPHANRIAGSQKSLISEPKPNIPSSYKLMSELGPAISEEKKMKLLNTFSKIQHDQLHDLDLSQIESSQKILYELLLKIEEHFEDYC
jgi:hypothetical protein